MAADDSAKNSQNEKDGKTELQTPVECSLLNKINEGMDNKEKMKCIYNCIVDIERKLLMQKEALTGDFDHDLGPEEDNHV